MNKVIIEKAQLKYNFAYEIKQYHIIIYFNNYQIELPNFEKFNNNYVKYINFISIPSDNIINIEKFYLRHYFINPIQTDNNVLVNILNFINLNTQFEKC